jgi:hypothetical protein
MVGDTKEPRSREKLAELDRRAWNLPRQMLAPVGPVREVWPVSAKATQTPATGEPPAAA